MKRFMLPAALTLCVAVGPAIAQAPASRTPATAPQQQQAAAPDVDPNALANAALQVVQAIDRDQTAGLWEGASAVTKRVAKREEFVAKVAETRKPLGAVVGRNWTVVRRQQVDEGGQIPAGLYASVEFVTRFRSDPPRTELVSMRRDEDGTWRFAGYIVK